MGTLLFGDDFRGRANPLLGRSGPVVVCLCAEWCGICRTYRTELTALAARFPDHAFVWFDVDDDADLIGDIDIETFPTLTVIRDDALLFGGVLLPHIQHLDRLLGTLGDRTALPGGQFGTLLQRLRSA